jgi:hypothetical protein
VGIHAVARVRALRYSPVETVERNVQYHPISNRAQGLVPFPGARLKKLFELIQWPSFLYF